MYSELYKPIPSLDNYLKRLNTVRPEKCNVASLDALIQAHQANVPFENIDIFDCHLPISLNTEDLYDKIVIRNRGGYCFELNALFMSALKACGYDAFACESRVTWRRDIVGPILHRQTLVNIDDELYVCDVGLGGPQPGFALKVEDGFTKSINEQTYRIVKKDYFWSVQNKTDEDWENSVEFQLIKSDEVDFIPLNYYCYASENSFFVNRRVVNLKTEKGNKSIGDNIFVINDGETHTEKIIENSKLMAQILSEHFGINDDFEFMI